MKIISGARQVHCDKCGCVYEFDAKDILRGIGVPKVLCPICGTIHELMKPCDYF